MTTIQLCAPLGLVSILLVSLGLALRSGVWLLARAPRVTTWGLAVLAFLMAGGAPLDIKAALTPGATFAQDTLRFIRSRSMVGLLAILAAASAYMHIHEHSLFAQVMPFLMAGIIGGLIGLLYLAARLVEGIDPIEPIVLTRV